MEYREPAIEQTPHDVGPLAPPESFSLAEQIEAFLPDLDEYTDGYEPSWNREAIIELPQQKLQADTHAILKSAAELLRMAMGELDQDDVEYIKGL